MAVIPSITRIVALSFTAHLLLVRTDAAVIPPARWGHASILCGETLFIHGGKTGVNPLSAPIGSDLYSLNISEAFNSFTTPWAALPQGPYAAYHSVGLVGSHNELLAVFGGNTSFDSSSSGNSLNLFNTVSGTWSLPTLKDPPRREHQAAVSRLDDGTMFVFGGMILGTDLLTESATAEMWTLGGYRLEHSNASGLTPQIEGWKQRAGPQVGTAPDRSFHTATLVRSSGLLVVIGGISAGALVSMSEILVYNTATGSWNVQTATGATPPLRRNHVAVAVGNGLIYVHGGTDLGATNYFADVAILDTASWSWAQPAIEGIAPTGRYSHAATTVGSNILLTFGLTAGGAANTLHILDTTSNTWVTSYAPSNLQLTSTKPEDWPGYKPPPTLPPLGPGPGNDTTPSESLPPSNGITVAPVVGGVVGVLVVSALLFMAVRQHRKHKLASIKAVSSSFYGPHNTRPLEAHYQPTGMAFDSEPVSFGQRMGQMWGGLTSGTFLGRKQPSQRLHDLEVEEESHRGLQMGPIPSDREIFLDAVHRARSRTGALSPTFAPLQQPIVTPGSPTSPRSPRSPRTSVGFADLPFGGGGLTVDLGEENEHGRAYSDGFENSMSEMEVQMLGVPRGRLFVVNPSDEATVNMDQDPSEYSHFDSQGPR